LARGRSLLVRSVDEPGAVLEELEAVSEVRKVTIEGERMSKRRRGTVQPEMPGLGGSI